MKNVNEDKKNRNIMNAWTRGYFEIPTKSKFMNLSSPIFLIDIPHIFHKFPR